MPKRKRSSTAAGPAAKRKQSDDQQADAGPRLPPEIINLIIDEHVGYINHIRYGTLLKSGIDSLFTNPFLRANHACRQHVLKIISHRCMWVKLIARSKEMREEVLDSIYDFLPVVDKRWESILLKERPMITFEFGVESVAQRTRTFRESRHTLIFPFNMESFLYLIGRLWKGFPAGNLSIQISKIPPPLHNLVRTVITPVLENASFFLQPEIRSETLDLDRTNNFRAFRFYLPDIWSTADVIYQTATNIRKLQDEGFWDEAEVYALHYVPILSNHIRWRFDTPRVWATTALARPDWFEDCENTLRMMVVQLLYSIGRLASEAFERRYYHAEWTKVHFWYTVNQREFWNEPTTSWFGLMDEQMAHVHCAKAFAHLFMAKRLMDNDVTTISRAILRERVEEQLKDYMKHLSIAAAYDPECTRWATLSARAIEQLDLYPDIHPGFRKCLGYKVTSIKFTSIDGESQEWIGDEAHLGLTGFGEEALPYLERAQILGLGAKELFNWVEISFREEDPEVKRLAAVIIEECRVK